MKVKTALVSYSSFSFFPKKTDCTQLLYVCIFEGIAVNSRNVFSCKRFYDFHEFPKSRQNLKFKIGTSCTDGTLFSIQTMRNHNFYSHSGFNSGLEHRMCMGVCFMKMLTIVDKVDGLPHVNV